MKLVASAGEKGLAAARQDSTRMLRCATVSRMGEHRAGEVRQTLELMLAWILRCAAILFVHASTRTVQDETDRFLWDIPLWEVATRLEPMQTCIGKVLRGPLRLPWETHAVLAPPANDDRPTR